MKTKYRNYTILKSGFNYRVKEPSGAWWPEPFANIKTCKRMIDCTILEGGAR